VTEIRSFTGEFVWASNFDPSPLWPSWWPRTLPPFPDVESAFQAWKIDTELPFTDRLALIEQIRSASTPGAAKRLGRKVPLRADWMNVRHQVMRVLLREKFSDLKRGSLLESTGNRLLVEGNNWHDQFWGDCTCGKPSCALPGENMLGKLLMHLRDERRDP
jgi:ribA/ribD-fused uncharacterized protein